MGYDKKYLSWALIYVICGMSLGIAMAEAHDYLHYAPAHVLLVGFVLSLVYGVIHNLWLISIFPLHTLPSVVLMLFHIRQAGALTMFTALLLLYGELFLDTKTEPMLASASITVLIITMTMLYATRSRATEKS